MSESRAHLERLVNVFGAILVRLFGRKLRLLELQKLTPENLQTVERFIKLCLSI